jgi:hypothetical protein
MKNQLLQCAINNTRLRIAILNKIASFFNLNNADGIVIIDCCFPNRIGVVIPNKNTIQFLKFNCVNKVWKIEIIPKTY